MISFNFNNLPKNINFSANFSESCEFWCSEETLEALKSKKLSVVIKQHSGNKILDGVIIKLACVAGKIVLSVNSSGQELHVGDKVKGDFVFRLSNKSRVVIGNETTSNGMKVYCNNSEFVCGSDCMFSSNILIQSSDQHGIVDISSKTIINNKWKSIRLGDHVWLGRNSTIMPNVTIGDGSVVGTGAIVTKNLPDFVIAAGIPAAVKKENCTWSRDPFHLDSFSRDACGL